MQTNHTPPATVTVNATLLAAFDNLHTAVDDLYAYEGLGDLLGVITYLYRGYLDHKDADLVTATHHNQVTGTVLMLLANLGRVYECHERVDRLISELAEIKKAGESQGV